MKSAIALTLVILTSTGFAGESKTLPEALKSLGLESSKLPLLTVFSIRNRGAKTMRFTEVVANGEDGSRLEIERTTPITREKAQSLAETKQGILEDLYEDRPTPYPGEVTNTFSCPSKFKPKRIEKLHPQQIHYALQGRASMRFLWGCCDPGQALTAFNAFVYDPGNRSLYRITSFQKNFSPTMASGIVQSLHFVNAP